MIKLLKPCKIWTDNGSLCGDGCCWNSWWEQEFFCAGEEINEENPKYRTNDLTEGEDYVIIGS